MIALIGCKSKVKALGVINLCKEKKSWCWKCLFPSQMCMQHLLNITKSLEKIERLLQGSRLTQDVSSKEPEGWANNAAMVFSSVLFRLLQAALV